MTLHADPPLLGTLRRRRVVAGDPSGATWHAWDTATGERLLLRLTGPGPVDEAVKRAVDSALPLRLRLEDVPGARARVVLRTDAFSCALADLLPLDGRAGSAWTARLALGVVTGLRSLHASGQVHGWIGPDAVVAIRSGWTLAWLGPVPNASADADLRAFGALFSALGSSGPVGELVAGFAEHPPPSADDAARLVVAACAEELAHARHTLARRARIQGAASRRARLVALARRLAAALPPPPAQGLADRAPGGLHVESAAGRVRAWHVPASEPASEPVLEVYGPGGHDAVAARTVLRSWASASDRDEALAPLIRWLRAAARLRVDRLLLASS